MVTFLKDFHRNSGFLVFLALFVQKVTAFLATLIIVRLLTQEEFGLLSIVPAAFALFAPFTGLGLPVALLRFGPLLKSNEEKHELASKTLKEGFLFQVGLAVLFLLSSLFFLNKYESILIVFVAFSLRLFGMLFLQHLQVYYRIQFDNRGFARVTIYTSLVGLALIILGSFIWGFYGYLLGFALSPFVSLLWYKRDLFKKAIASIGFSSTEIYSFSLHSAFTNFSSDLLFALDILILSYFLNESSVAAYKVAILIPANMVFLTQSFIQSDYPKIAANGKNRLYLRNYIIQFFKVFVPVSLIILLIGWLFSEPIISLFFGSRYSSVSQIFFVLLIAFSASMLFRVLFGNMLSAIGKMSSVTFATVSGVIILIISAVILVPRFEIQGMAYSMLFALLFCSFLLAVFFFRELRNLE